MIPKLRRKFISITAAALFAVILLVVGSINCIFYFQNTRLLSSHLDLLLQEYSTDPMRPPGSRSDRPAPPPGGGTDAPELPQAPDSAFGGNRGPWRDFSLLPRFENNLRVPTDGCVILLSADGSIAGIRQNAAENYTAGELTSIVARIYNGQASEGWYQYYRFRRVTRQTSEGGTEILIALVNASTTLYAVFTMLSVSALIGLVSFLVVLFLIIFASGRAVRPIAESYARQKQFVTDASHELKTPLTVISANNELAKMIYGDSEWFDSIDRQVGKMNGLVRSLVSLARMEEEQKPELSSFNLSDAVYDTVKSFENLIHARGRVLTLDIAENICYIGDESKIRQVVSILMDNAVKYCDEQGKIAVRLTADKSIHLLVTNDYAAFQDFDPGKAFERFYRGDKARTSDGGYGLGLSIAKSIAKLHKGEIHARILEHGRVQFEMILPGSRPLTLPFSPSAGL